MHACLMTFGSSKIWVNPAIFKSFFQAGMILLIVIICVLQEEFLKILVQKEKTFLPLKI
jgi:hypothetical protein